MKKISAFSVIFLLALCFSCEHNFVNSIENGAFAIYLLADSAITAVEAAKQSMDVLVLAEKPMISTKDLVFYWWSNHNFSLMADAVNRLQSFEHLGGKSFGIPF